MTKPDDDLFEWDDATGRVRTAKKTYRQRRREVDWDSEAESASYDDAFYAASEHYYERALPAFHDWLRSLRPRSIVEMGCGTGAFVAGLVGEIPVRGLDLGAGAGGALPAECFDRVDLTRPIFEQVERFRADLVLCLECYEHIPPQYEEQLLANLVAPRPRILVLSVATPRQWGRHHYNCRSASEVRPLVEALGYVEDVEAAAPLRTMRYLAGFYKENTMVFRKKGKR